jgi:SAM-dependent methyltransferase
MIKKCPICYGKKFKTNQVLWPRLIEEWQLSNEESNYINRQQGFCCIKCGGNLRSMSLANAIIRSYKYENTFDQFCREVTNADLNVLEINPAGTLTKHLKYLPKYQLIKFPEYDMEALKIASAMYDLVIHSDTLEHVSLPVTALKECCRILKNNGRCIFTVPIIVERLSRSRNNLSESYHGREHDVSSDLLVHTEFGADIWTYVFSAGFKSCTIHCFEYPAGLAIEARC